MMPMIRLAFGFINGKGKVSEPEFFTIVYSLAFKKAAPFIELSNWQNLN